MLSLRLVLRARPPVLLRLLLLTAASAVLGTLLLGALARAHTTSPEHGRETLAALLCSGALLAAAGQLAAANGRTVPTDRVRAGLTAAGLGTARLSRSVAAVTASCCLAGSVAAGLYTLWRPSTGEPAVVTGPLTAVAALALLGAPPLVTAVAAGRAAARRPPPGTEPAAVPASTSPNPQATHRSTARTPDSVGPDERSSTRPLWGAALGVAGLVAAAYGAAHGLPPLHGTLGTAAGVLAGWLLLALGVALSVPGVLDSCGRAVAAGQPGALRLLSGRALQQQAHRMGGPLGLLCVVGAGSVAALQLSGAGLLHAPLGAAGAAGLLLVPVCAVVGALTGRAAWQAERAAAAGALRQLGAGRTVRRRSAVLRGGVLLGVLAPLAWVTGTLATLAVTG